MENLVKRDNGKINIKTIILMVIINQIIIIKVNKKINKLIKINIKNIIIKIIITIIKIKIIIINQIGKMGDNKRINMYQHLIKIINLSKAIIQEKSRNHGGLKNG